MFLCLHYYPNADFMLFSGSTDQDWFIQVLGKVPPSTLHSRV
jgi:hypothetical protein